MRYFYDIPFLSRSFILIQFLIPAKEDVFKRPDNTAVDASCAAAAAVVRTAAGVDRSPFYDLKNRLNIVEILKIFCFMLT